MNFAVHYLFPIFKTILDYCLSLIALVILFPLIIVMAASIKLYDTGPVLFRQVRTGKDGKLFTLYKFRSMHRGSESGIELLSGKKDPRITPFGRFMRKHKLDEIPNLINVLKGDMSIIGPRPEQPYFTNQLLIIIPDYRQILALKPGITSWGQVEYGYAKNVEQMAERFNCDLYYLQNRSAKFDLRIIIRTIGIILKGAGV